MPRYEPAQEVLRCAGLAFLPVEVGQGAGQAQRGQRDQDTAGETGTHMRRRDQALAELDEGDTLVVWRLDRLGRSLPHLVATIDNLTRRGVNLRSLHEAIDTTTPTGRLMVHLIASLAEFERELTIERTIAGLEAAKARGANLGRPTVWTPQRAGAATVTQTAAALGVSRASPLTNHTHEHNTTNV